MGVGVRGEPVLGMKHDVSNKRAGDIAEDRERLPFDDDGGGGSLGGICGLGHDHTEHVGLPAAHVARHYRAAGVIQPEDDRLIKQRQAVFIDRHISCRENRHHSRGGSGHVKVERH